MVDRSLHGVCASHRGVKGELPISKRKIEGLTRIRMFEIRIAKRQFGRLIIQAHK